MNYVNDVYRIVLIAKVSWTMETILFAIGLLIQENINNSERMKFVSGLTSQGYTLSGTTMPDQNRKSTRKAAKKIIRLAKENPDWYTKQDVYYAKMIKKVTKKQKPKDD